MQSNLIDAYSRNSPSTAAFGSSSIRNSTSSSNNNSAPTSPSSAQQSHPPRSLYYSQIITRRSSMQVSGSPRASTSELSPLLRERRPSAPGKVLPPRSIMLYWQADVLWCYYYSLLSCFLITFETLICISLFPGTPASGLALPLLVLSCLLLHSIHQQCAHLLPHTSRDPLAADTRDGRISRHPGERDNSRQQPGLIHRHEAPAVQACTTSAAAPPHEQQQHVRQ